MDSAINSPGARVCVVDDDASVRRALIRFFRAADFAVEAFATAEDFLASGASDECGCAILDVRMPGMDGLALQEAISVRSPGLPVIMISARDDPRAEERALRNGASEFLHKPVSGEQLIAAVRAALRE